MGISTALASPLDYYARIGAALFPIPAGQKNPTGIVASFALDCSSDPAQWARWRAANPQCNFGIVAGPSRLIIMDTDAKDDRNAAWAARCELLTSWGMDPATLPTGQSARGGWHDLFAVPDNVDARSLRQPDAIKNLVNVRAGNGFVLTAGSYYDGTARSEASGPYILLSDAPPHPAPAALIEHCTRRARASSAASLAAGSRDIGDVSALITWLAERGTFDAYEDWVSVGMALKLELGDAGRDVWAIAHDATVDADTEESKWNSFASEPAAGCVTLNSFLSRAHALGWHGTVRKSASAMFDGVAQIAAAAGAALPNSSLFARGEEQTRVCGPLLDEFLAATSDSPSRPLATDGPVLSDAMSGHGLYNLLRNTIDRILAMAERAGDWKGARTVDALSVLWLIHRETYDAVARRIRALGRTIPESKIKLAGAALEEQIERAFIPQDGWHIDARSGFPEADNSDNVAVFLKLLGLDIRWNAWLERAEVYGGTDQLRFPVWSYVDDTVIAKLRTRGNRTKTRFRPGKEFFFESLLSLAHENTIDPALALLSELQAAWDGVPRLSRWLSRACCVVADPYHVAVARSIIGGLVTRIRHPGCKWDTMPIFFGPQGTGKSSMAAILALRAEYFTDSILLGDASKELVLSLAGKALVEISEMGIRGNTNANHVKAMISRTVDAGRTAYARSVTERPRRNTFVGTANDDTPLEDPTGNRRFLPVAITQEIDLVWLRSNIHQIVGEACALEASGTDFAIPRDVWSDAARHQEAARQESDVETLLVEWFAEPAFSYITAADLVHLSQLAGWRAANSGRSMYMKSLGFRKDQAYLGGRRTRIWVRGPVALPRQMEGAVRYMVGADNVGRPTVTIRTTEVALGASVGVGLPALPR